MADEQPAPAQSDFPASLTYGQLSTKHASWDGEYIAQLRALYKGGRDLLRNPVIMAQVFPPHRDETVAVYAERCKRAFYVPYASEIIGFIVASLTAERLTLLPEGADDSDDMPEWWAKWVKDVSPNGGKKISLHDFVKGAVTEGLVCKTAWARVDMPRSDVRYDNRKDQEEAGQLDAFAVMAPNETVINWDEDETGQLLWVKTHCHDTRPVSFADNGETLKEVWWIYTGRGAAKYEFARKLEDKPSEHQPVARVVEVKHSFGRVPWVRLDTCDDESGLNLWCMNIIEGMVRAQFNQRCGTAWAMFQSLHQELYEFLEPSQPSGTPDDVDPSRAVTQARGQGFVQVRGSNDKVEFVGPDTSAFEEARKSDADMRTEIHRVLYQMALTTDNSAAALRRSAESKGHDKASAVVVFEALGQLARKFAQELADMVARGRQELDLVDKWHAKGMATFDAVSVDASIDQATKLELVPIPSPTFQKRYKEQLAKAILGDEASQEDLDAIHDELEQNITADNMARVSGGAVPPPSNDNDETDDGDGKEPADVDEEDDTFGPKDDDEERMPERRKRGASKR